MRLVIIPANSLRRWMLPLVAGGAFALLISCTGTKASAPASPVVPVLADYIRQRIDAGQFRPLDPLLAARGFFGMVIYHSWIQELYGGKRYQDFPVQQVSRTLAELWLRGMLNNGKDVDGRQAAKSNHGNHRRKQNHAARSHSS